MSRAGRGSALGIGCRLAFLEIASGGKSHTCHTVFEPPNDVLGISLPGRRSLEPVGRSTTDVWNAQLVELATEVKGLVVQTLVDHCAVEVDRAQQSESRDDVCREVYLSPGSDKGLLQILAGKQRPFNNEDLLSREVSFHVDYPVWERPPSERAARLSALCGCAGRGL